MHVCSHKPTHRDTAFGVFECEPRSRDETPGEPIESS